MQAIYKRRHVVHSEELQKKVNKRSDKLSFLKRWALKNQKAELHGFDLFS